MSELYLIEYFGVKVLIATLCGVIIGIEREIKGKVAGIRTNLLFCVGVTMFTSSAFLYADQNPNIDPTRIIGQIITGIGFMGTGVIFKSDNKIVGVTSASFIWVMSALGVMIGSGFYLISIILAIGLVILSLFFEKVERRIRNWKVKKGDD